MDATTIKLYSIHASTPIQHEGYAWRQICVFLGVGVGVGGGKASTQPKGKQDHGGVGKRSNTTPQKQAVT
jgi:hypothetical protein